MATYALPIIGPLPVCTVDTAAVMTVLEQLAHIPNAQARLRRRLEAAIDWAKARGFFVGENPARQSHDLARYRLCLWSSWIAPQVHPRSVDQTIRSTLRPQRRFPVRDDTARAASGQAQAALWPRRSAGNDADLQH